MSIRSFACQLAVRLSLVAALLTTAGITAHSATNWQPTTAKVDTPPPAGP